MAELRVSLKPNNDPTRRTGPIGIPMPDAHQAAAVTIEIETGAAGCGEARLEITVDTWNGLPRIKSIVTRDFS